jgi:hypothetical protein
MMLRCPLTGDMDISRNYIWMVCPIYVVQTKDATEAKPDFGLEYNPTGGRDIRLCSVKTR